ncbi:thiamine pyrophosphokinase [Schizophyllum amplum]|uniref:Thiamine pyrophosphokinase n=1 Tax=Schizophyllum amplum TaxID=97359 RepID=A0A550C183_9AGAR|nr:thiamine pyrophosphokinase [Auriculariopsis ampla]
MSITKWDTSFLRGAEPKARSPRKRALIILNQPFSIPLLKSLWASTEWHCCADGGANRLSDVLGEARRELLPELIKGDLDSLRDDVRGYYESVGVPVVYDGDQYSTDLMKCVSALEEKERAEGTEQHDIIILGGLSGRLDQTVHTLSYLHKLRHKRQRVFAVTDENVGWVLDEGEHEITIDHSVLGQTCGLLPVGIDSTVLTTRGLRWNLTEHESSFDGLVSTSNHLDPEHDIVYVKTTKPIWWTAELRS